MPQHEMVPGLIILSHFFVACQDWKVESRNIMCKNTNTEVVSVVANYSHASADELQTMAHFSDSTNEEQV